MSSLNKRSIFLVSLTCVVQMNNKRLKKVLPAVILLGYSILSIAAYIATGFPDASCGCPVKLTIFFSTIASPVLIAIALLLIRKDRMAASGKKKP